MGRPPKKPEDKRQLVSVRFDPEVREAFERAAAASGRSLAGEVEMRAKVLADVDEQTVEMVSEIVQQMRALERRNHGKRWHKNLRTWAAVTELMADGPIVDLKPVHDEDAEVQADAWQPLSIIFDKQRDLVSALKALGFTARTDRTVTKGLLGGFSSRTAERAGIETHPDPELVAKAISLHEALCQLDEEAEQARKSWAEAMQPYWDEEKAGRQMYRDHLHEEAQSAS